MESTSGLNLLIADRLPLFSSGIQHMLMAEGGYARIDVTDTRKELLQYVSSFMYDVVLVDTQLDKADGVELLRQIRQFKPQQKVLFFGDWNNELFLQQCLFIGLQGYLFKQVSLRELNRAIRSVASGNEFFSREISNRVFKIAGNPGALSDLLTGKLNERELEVLKRVVHQFSNQEIADDLHISLSMVKKYKTSLLEKTSSRNSVGLTLYALDKGLFSTNDLISS
jgi:DNA-binding NarL/FixJ family response regulator